MRYGPPCFAMAALLMPAVPARSASEPSPLDLATGTAVRRLPFDVPFFLEEGCVEVLHEPDAGAGAHRGSTKVFAGEELRPSGVDGVAVRVADLFA